MKIFIIDTYYENFLNDFYSKNEEIKYKNCNEQKSALLAEQFGTADFYSKNLKKLGHQAEEFIVNNEILQKQWAKENNIKYRKDYFQKIPKIKKILKPDWFKKILEAQIAEFKPDIIYSQNLSVADPVFLKKIKKHAKLLVGQIACPLPPKQYLQAYDLILTSFPHYIQKFKNLGINSEYFRIGFEHTILDKLSHFETKYDTVFIGGFSQAHSKGTELLEYLSGKVKMDFWGYGADSLTDNSLIRKNYHGEAWALKMYNILFNSKIAINRHIDVAENYANNMRLYETTGVGSMLITDYKSNLNELFEIGKEIETYSTNEELAEKINYYLTHEDERKKIASAGQKKTLKDHAYEIRMKELIEIFKKIHLVESP